MGIVIYKIRRCGHWDFRVRAKNDKWGGYMAIYLVFERDSDFMPLVILYIHAATQSKSSN